MLNFLYFGRVAIISSLSFVLTFSSSIFSFQASAATGYWDARSGSSPGSYIKSEYVDPRGGFQKANKQSEHQLISAPGPVATESPSINIVESERGVQWKDAQKAHWEHELNKYYRSYIGNEDSLPQTVDRLNSYTKNARFFDFVRAWDPHKGYIPWSNSPSNQRYTDYVSVKFKEISVDLYKIPGSVSCELNAQDRASAKLWNENFSKLNGGSGPIHVVTRGQDGYDKEINRLCAEAGISNCSDTFKDALKASSQNYSENEKSEKIALTREVKEKPRVKWRIEPLIYANIDLSKKFVDLTPYKPGQPNPDPNDPQDPNPNPNPNPDPDDPTNEPPGPFRDALLSKSKILLQPGNGKYGYQYTATDMFGIGGGAGIHTVIDISSPAVSFFKQIGFVVGGMLILNRIQTVSRRVPSMTRVTSDRVYKNPSAENISKYWNVDDSFSYMGSGGIMLTAGASYAAIVVGPTFITEASVQKIVTKIAPTKVMVEVADISLNSGSVTIGAGPLSYSNIVANYLDKTKKTYLFDLSLEAGRRSFEQMMIGNYYDAQALIAGGQTVAVVELSREFNKTNSDTGGSSIFMFGLPFLYKVWMKDNQSSSGKIENYADHIDTKYNHGIYVDREERRLIVDPISPITNLWYNLTGRKTEAIEFNSHKYLTKAFYGGIEKINNYDQADQATQNYYGRAVWNFQYDHSKKTNLKESMDEMIYMDTGLEELDVNDSQISWELGYLNIELLMDLNRNATNVLMNLLESGTTEFLRELERVADVYFSPEYMSRVNPYGDFYYANDKERDYCEKKLQAFKYINPDGRQGRVDTVLEAKEYCKRKVLSEGKNTVKEMVKILQDMRELVISNDENKEEFAHLYREFGKLMLTNRFTYRMIYNLLVSAEFGDFVRFTLNGERVANLNLNLPSGIKSKSLVKRVR